MKVYTDAVYNMRMCMKEDNLCSKSISREIISSAGEGYPFVISFTVLIPVRYLVSFNWTYRRVK